MEIAHLPVHNVHEASGTEGEDDALPVAVDLVVDFLTSYRVGLWVSLVVDARASASPHVARCGDGDLSEDVARVVRRLARLGVAVVKEDGDVEADARRAERGELGRIAVVSCQVEVWLVE